MTDNELIQSMTGLPKSEVEWLRSVADIAFGMSTVRRRAHKGSRWHDLPLGMYHTIAKFAQSEEYREMREELHSLRDFAKALLQFRLNTPNLK